MIALIAFGNYTASAQTDGGRSFSNDFKKNIVKVNLPALAVRNFSFQYERGLNENMSVALGVRFMPKGGLPLKGLAENLSGGEEDASEESDDGFTDFLDNSKISNWAITPEFRYYFGKKPLNGFYMAPFVRFGGFNISWDYAFEDDMGQERDAILKGNASTFSAGLLLGAQWHLGEYVVLDWWILGPAYGRMNVTLDANTDLSDLSDESKQTIREDLTVDIMGNEVDAQVDDNGIRANVTTPFGGLRTGLCLGITF